MLQPWPSQLSSIGQSYCWRPAYAPVLCCFELPPGAPHPCQHAYGTRTELEQTLLRSNNRHLTSGVEARRVKIENRSIDSTFSSYSPDFFLFCALFLRSEGLSILHGPNEGSA